MGAISLYTCLAVFLFLVGCVTPAGRLKTEVVMSKSGKVKESYTYYLDASGRRVYHGNRYIFSGKGIGSVGVGVGVVRKYKDGVLIEESNFALHP